MMLKQITKNFMKASLLLNKNIYTCFSLDPMIKHYAQMNMRGLRRKFLKQSVLNHSKNVIWAQKRQLNENVIALKDQGKCVGVIKRYGLGKQQEVDVILPAKVIKGLRKNNNNGLLTVYVRVQGQQYRCILDNILNHNEGWIAKVILNQYAPNKPNKLIVPIQVSHLQDNPYVQSGSQVEIICFNQEYPLKFYADISYACPQRPYRIGDLANTFPPGVILDPQVNPNAQIIQINPPERIQLHMKKKLMKTYMAGTKKQKAPTGGAATTGGATGGASGGKTPQAGGTAATGGGNKQKK